MSNQSKDTSEKQDFDWDRLATPAIGPLILWGMLIVPTFFGVVYGHSPLGMLAILLFIWTAVAVVIVSPRISKAYAILKADPSARTLKNLASFGAALLLIWLIPILVVSWHGPRHLWSLSSK